MKYIICPFCKHRIAANEFPKQQKRNGHVEMPCPGCKRRLAFTILESHPSTTSSQLDENKLPASESAVDTHMALHVVENRFGYAAQFPLLEGMNRVGRYNNKHTDIEVAIRTSDPSMDRHHCLIFVERVADGNDFNAYIMDDDSMTGTFINMRELVPDEKHLLEDGEVITLGATSILFSKQ